MKILFLNTFYPPDTGGGAEITLRTLVEGLQRAGHDVVVLRLSGDHSIREETRFGVRVILAPCRNVFMPHTHLRPPALHRLLWHAIDVYNPFMAGIVDEVCRAESPDIVSCHNLAGWSVSAWRAVRRRSIPIVQVLHDYYLLCVARRLYNRRRVCASRCIGCKSLRAFHRSASANVSAVVGISQYVLRTHLDAGYFPQVRISSVIHNARRIPCTEHAWPDPESSPLRFGYLGSLAQAKGIGALVDAFSQLRGNVELHIAGTGTPQYVSSLKARAPRRALFHGAVDAQVFLNTVDCLVVPSLWPEPLGMVAPEAMAHGLPVIAARSGGLPEMIDHGRTGVVFDPDEPGGLSRALQFMVDHRREMPRMGSAACEAARRFTNVDAWVRQYTGIYSTLLSPY